MSIQFSHLVNALGQNPKLSHLDLVSRGIEKESLRITPDGRLSQSTHPHKLGSALTNPNITTDYSEALLELITEPHQSIDSVLKQLTDTHQFVYQNIDHELLWVNSMPCIIGGDLNIPIAQYGSSNVGRMKTIYRHGLWHRYGRMMQAIAGIHFNFSFPIAFWKHYQEIQENNDPLQDFISENYFKLIRNFQRFAWLPVYLFGASPAVCATFLKDREHSLKAFHGSNTFHLPDATSLRMSDLGYQNDAQADLAVCYNSLDTYVACLNQAIKTPHPAYESIGVKKDNEYMQLNANLLQIENEYYGNIRPKRTAKANERPTQALSRGGVEYIEVRCLDLDPFSPIGISENTVKFFDAFLLFCLLEPNPGITPDILKESESNLESVVYQGRSKDLQIIQSSGQKVSLKESATGLLNKIGESAELFDSSISSSDSSSASGDSYASVIHEQLQKVKSPELTPSAKILNTLEEENCSFFEFALEQAKSHKHYFKSLESDPETTEALTKAAEQSHIDQKTIEQEDQKDFEEFIDDYFSS